MCHAPAWHPASAAQGFDRLVAPVDGSGGVSTLFDPSGITLMASLPFTNCAIAAGDPAANRTQATMS
jgi:hypothetical protein